jgi:ABC-2 type transport system permease protein
MTQTLPLLRASFTMMLRSRGVIYAMVAIPVQIVAFGLLGGLGFGIGGTRLDFLDFALPGMAALLPIMSLEDITVAIAASHKARGVLRRLAATPVSPARFVAAQILGYIVLGLVASGLALAIGAVMGARLVIAPNLLWLIPLQVIGVLTALSIAFALAGLTPNPATANIVGGAVVLPVFALTGAILPVAALPAPLPDIVPYVVPYSSLVEAIRGITLTGASITEYGTRVAVGIAWLVVMFSMAASAYRFTED